MPAQHDLALLVAAAAAARPEAPALVAGGTRVTWAELEDDVARVATGLGEAGIVAGQRVLVALGNRPELVTTYLGVLRAQAVAARLARFKRPIRVEVVGELPHSVTGKVQKGRLRRPERRRGRGHLE